MQGNWKTRGNKKRRELINLDALYEAVDVVKLAHTLGFERIKNESGAWLQCSCPFTDNHKHGDVHRSFGIKQDGSGFCNCFSCGGMSLIKLIMKLKHLDFPEARDWLVSFTNKNITFETREDLEKPVFSFTEEQLSAVTKRVSKYALKRGVSESVYKQFQLGYNPLNKSVYFPVFDFDKHLIGLVLRRTDQKFYQNVEGFNKAEWLYGLEHAKMNRLVYLVEGMFDVLVLKTLGYNAVGSFGAMLSERQAELLIDNFTSVCYLMDRDEAGKRGRIRAFERLAAKLPFYTTKTIEGKKDVAEMSVEQIKRITDNRFLFVP